MPLKSVSLSSKVCDRIQKRIRSLQKSGVIAPADEKLDAGFSVYIQLAPKKQARTFFFGRPEGIRVFVQSGKTVVAAIDFLFAGKTLRLIHVHHGEPLTLLVKMLNKLEKSYARQKKIYQAELISFLFIKGIYLLVRSGKTQQFYFGSKKRFVPVSPADLKGHIEKIISEQKDFVIQ